MKDYINGDTIANEIRMKRSHVDVAFLIVEGENDFKTLHPFVDHESCQIIIAFGKKNALDSHQVLSSDEFDGFLVLVDADFDRLLGVCREDSNLIVTDLHDLDCMLLNSQAFDRVLGELAEADRLGGFVANYGGMILSSLAESAKPVGCMLLISIREQLNLTFDRLDFGKFIDRQSLHCDVTSMVQEVLNKSQRHDIDSTAIEKKVLGETTVGHELWQVVRGHDVINVFSIALRRVFAAKRAADVTLERLEERLRLAYERAGFEATFLAASILEWENRNPPYKVLLNP